MRHLVRRGRRVLKGSLAPRLARLTAVALVMLGIGCEKKTSSGERVATTPPDTSTPPPRASTPSARADAAPDRSAAPAIAVDDALPGTFGERTVREWLALQRSSSDWSRFKLESTRSQLGGVAPPSPAALDFWSKTLVMIFEADAGAALAPRTALSALDEAEAAGLYDHWLVAALWRRTAGTSEADERDLETLYARFRRHARTTDALLLAIGLVKPTMLPARAWMSKAGPSASQRAADAAAVRDVLAATRDVYAKTDAGTWLRDGAVLLDPVSDAPSPLLARGGQRSPLAAGARVGRLDLLVTAPGAASAVSHAWLGRIELPAGRTLSVFRLPELVGPGARAKIAATVSSALAGDEAAALDIERALPLVHPEVRSAVRGSPNAKGAPRLRTILALFDDVPMPPPAEDHAVP